MSTRDTASPVRLANSLSSAWQTRRPATATSPYTYDAINASMHVLVHLPNSVLSAWLIRQPATAQCWLNGSSSACLLLAHAGAPHATCTNQTQLVWQSLITNVVFETLRANKASWAQQQSSKSRATQMHILHAFVWLLPASGLQSRVHDCNNHARFCLHVKVQSPAALHECMLCLGLHEFTKAVTTCIVSSLHPLGTIAPCVECCYSVLPCTWVCPTPAHFLLLHVRGCD